MQDVDFPATFAADFISEFSRAFEKSSEGEESFHSWKVCITACKIGEALRLDKTQMKELFFASLLHDIGGVTLSGHVVDSLLQVPDIFGQKNDFFVFAHSHRSQTILRGFPTFRKISGIVGSHHEFYDGTGFPSGLKGEKIPFLSRIIRVADSIDIFSRLHKVDDASELILFLNMISGEEFDPEIYATFVNLAKNGFFDLIKTEEGILNEMQTLKKQMEDKYYFASADTVNRFFKMVAILTDNITSHQSSHSTRVAEISVQIAYLMGLDPEEILAIRWASFLHDIGKVAGDRNVYLKREKLTEEEWLSIRKHPQKSYDIINSVAGMDKIAYYILHHHENFNGTGYPGNLSAKMIPIGSRIIRVADAFDAMTTNRIYHRKKDWQRALNELKKYSGTQFDPDVVEVFINDIS